MGEGLGAPLGAQGVLLRAFNVATLLLVSVLSTAAEGPAHDAQQNWQYTSCRPDDARCLALQRDVCDPWNTTAATDRCTFVQADSHCKEDVQRVNYLALFYCNNAVAMCFAMCGWALLLFAVMTVAAEVFLCPALEFLAEWMALAPDIAGVTLFAFASGAPDLFTQVAALAEGDHVDIELAVSATFGGGLFIICVVLPAVILTNSSKAEDPQVPDRRAYLRDSTAYLVASLFTLCLLRMGQLTVLGGVLLLVGYMGYLGVCLATRSGAQASGRAAYQPLTPQYALHQQEQQLAYQQQSGLAGAANRETEMASSAFAAEDPGSPFLRPGIALKSSNPASPVTARAQLDNGLRPRSTTGIPQLQKEGSFALNPAESSSSSARAGAAALAAFDGIEAGLPQQQLTPAKPWQQPLPRGAGRLQEIDAMLNEYLHLHGTTGPRRWLAYATAPLVLFMHATMPALNSGTFSMAYGAVLAITFPPFFLLGASLSPLALGGSAFATIWVTSSLVIYTLLFAMGPATTAAAAVAAGGGTMVGGLNGSPNAPQLCAPLPRPATPTAAGTAAARLAARRPRRGPLLALLAFLQCIVWLNAAADELVALLEAVGRIWNVRRDVLGATVLAWGEAVPDLVAVVTLAKSGQGTMAIAACFGGPVFNLLVSMGAPIVYAASKNGPVQYQMTSGLLILVGATVVALAFLLAAVPLRFKWGLPRVVGIVLLVFYAAIQVVFLLAEGIVIS